MKLKDPEMKRRTMLKLTAAGAAAPFVLPTTRAAAATGDTAFVLVHGSWHAGWCWSLIEPALNNAGCVTVAVDLPGHGLGAALPHSFLTRPLDPAAFAAEPSAIAAITIDAYADAVLAGVGRAAAAGARNVFLVGHSMGGVPATFAAARQPESIAGIIYINALAPTPGKPAGAYLGLEDQHANSLIGNVIAADPSVIGALRMDPRSDNPDYLDGARKALAADVEPALWNTAMHLFTPDAPVAIYGEALDFPPAFGALKRTWLRSMGDRTLMPSTAGAIVADMNRAWPESPTRIIDMDASHEVIFSQPEAVAAALIAAV